MNRLLITAIAVTAMIAGCTPSVPEEQGHLKPDRQAGLLPFYEAHPVEAGSIVLVGDDLIADGLWAEALAEVQPRLYNRGIPGDCLADVAVRAKKIAKTHPYKLFISAGINDFERASLERTEGQKYVDYEPVVQRVALETQKLLRDLHRISPKTELYWLSLYEIAAQDPDIYPALHRVNKAVEAYAKKSGAFTYIDLDRALSQGIEEEELSYTRGRWLNGAGYTRVAGFVATRCCTSNQMSALRERFTEQQFANVQHWNGTREQQGRESGYYLDRLSQFMALPHGKGGVVLFGDSLIDFGPWDELLPEFPVHPRGIAGDLLAGFTARVDEVAAQNPEAVVLIGGCNNLVKTPERAPEDIWKDYEALLAAIRKAMPAVPLFVESILPLNPKDADEYDGFNARAAVLNSFLATPEAQAKYNYRYLDLAASLRDENGDLGEEYTTDGCHLTPAAYQIWADQLREALKGLNMRQ